MPWDEEAGAIRMGREAGETVPKVGRTVQPTGADRIRMPDTRTGFTSVSTAWTSASRAWNSA